jgi:hypothetical protein
MRRAAWAIVAANALCGCAGASAQPEVPSAPTSLATAELHAEDPVSEAANLLSPVVLARASTETEQPIEASRVNVASHASGRVLLRVLASTPRQAVVGCMALLRAAEQQRAHTPEADRVARRLTEDRDALRAELGALDKSLREISQDGGAGEAISVQAESMRVKVERLALSEARTVEAAATSQQAPELLTLAAESARYATLQAITLANEGRGPGHPDMVAARAKIDTLEARFRVQLTAEEGWLSALEAQLAKAPPSGDAVAAKKVRLAALLDVLDRPEATPERGVASELPLRLRLIAREYEERWIEDADLSRVLGDRHPRRAASAARLREVAAEFDRERTMLVSQARTLLAAGVGADLGRIDVRPAQLDDVKLRLAHVLVRMDEIERRATMAPSVRLVRSCAASL